MTDLQETLAEVTALIPRYSWEIMDEEQRDQLMEKIVLPRWNKTTADGVKLGPTAWGKILGASVRAIEGREYRLRQADEKPTSYREHVWKQARRSHAKAVLREAGPDELAEIFRSDDKIATNVAKAAQRVEQSAIERTRQAQRERSPELVHRAGFNQVAGELLRVKRNYAKALDEARELELPEDEAEALDDIVSGMDTVSDWFHSFLRSGSQGFEQDLENLLAEGG